MVEIIEYTDEGVRLYPLRDSIPFSEREGLRHRCPKDKSIWQSFFRRRVRAVMVPHQEACRPKQGEWYISGAIPEAYYANQDLPYSRYQLARIVVIDTVIREIQGRKLSLASPQNVAQ